MDQRFLCVGVAGALGTWTRYLVALGAARILGTPSPLATLLVNVIGCFLFAAVIHVSLTTTLISPTLRVALTTGFMGGLTTYSSFNFEVTKLVQEGALGAGALYFAVTTLTCLGAGLAGVLVASRVFGT